MFFCNSKYQKKPDCVVLVFRILHSVLPVSESETESLVLRKCIDRIGLAGFNVTEPSLVNSG